MKVLYKLIYIVDPDALLQEYMTIKISTKKLEDKLSNICIRKLNFKNIVRKNLKYKNLKLNNQMIGLVMMLFRQLLNCTILKLLNILIQTKVKILLLFTIQIMIQNHQLTVNQMI